MSTRQSPLASYFPPNTTLGTVGDAQVALAFSDASTEATALREHTALIDLSATGRIRVEGAGATDLVQRLFARDAAYLFPERSMTGLLLAEDATVVDLIILYRTTEGYLIETSIGGGSRTLAHLKSHAPADVTLEDTTMSGAVIGIEGPYAWQVLAELFNSQLTGLPYQGVAKEHFADAEIMISRTGYTAEYGYKLFVPVHVAGQLWTQLAEMATPIGFDALDTAMVEVRHPVLHRELPAGGNVLRSGLNWFVDLQKDDFMGREALGFQREDEGEFRSLNFVAERGIDLTPGTPIFAAREVEVGRVVHAVYSTALGQQVGIAHTAAEWTAAGLDFEVLGEDAEFRPVRSVSGPVLTPRSWLVPVV